MTLPDFRKALHGRTFSQPWEPNPIEGYRKHGWLLSLFFWSRR